MLALAVLTMAAIAGQTDPPELIPISVPEARRLINATHHALAQTELNRAFAWSTR
jgi:hypothetical protein